MIAVGSDHGGIKLKKEIIKHLDLKNIFFKDYGTHEKKSVDYPDIAEKVCAELTKSDCNFGILICKTGIGMCMAANKYKNIRAVRVTCLFDAKISRKHNNANIICLGEKTISQNTAIDVIKTFIETDFDNGRHLKRITKIEKNAEKFQNQKSDDF
ncbi:MAG: ribose 5-phosphate isomerase B [Clostridiales bacterium]|jgi:ribose 5-phosphate isomerase B|nr:ribose 5-phosphate isomerase B [Clostridiales bacterium]